MFLLRTSQIRDLTNQFLKDTFPKAIAFGAIHRDTEHPHVHVYLHARQTDGKKIYLSRQEYASIDASNRVPDTCRPTRRQG